MSAVSLTATALAGAALGCAVVGGLGQVAAGRARADTAADLAALAAAARVVRGEPGTAACELGAQVAAGPAVALVGCVVDGEVVSLTVRAEVTVLGVTLPVTSAARAGPVGP